MDDRQGGGAWAHWILLFLGVLALCLVIFDLVLYLDVRALRAELAERQRTITEGVQLVRLNNELIQLVANTAASSKDAELQALLAANGITYQVNPPAAPPAASPEATEDQQ